MARTAPVQPVVSKEEQQYLERALASLPASKTSASDASSEADGLLKFAYHQNPYMRTFTKVLWSGYALARGQLAEGSQRFSQARRDATVSAVDQATTKALDEAAAALEQAMSPSGSINRFLAELRERTMHRLWSRVCETCGLPPPRFHVLYGKKAAVNQGDLDAAEEAEIAALRLDVTGGDDGDDDDDYEDDDEDEDTDAEAAAEPSAAPVARVADKPAVARSAALPAAATKAEEEEDDDEATESAEESGHTTPASGVAVTRSGSAAELPELILAAAAELLRELRGRKPEGMLKVTLTVEGQRAAGTGAPGGGNRKRRRRRK